MSGDKQSKAGAVVSTVVNSCSLKQFTTLAFPVVLKAPALTLNV